MQSKLELEECLAFPTLPKVPRSEALAINRFIDYFGADGLEAIYLSTTENAPKYEKPIGKISSKGADVFSRISKILDGSKLDELEAAEKILSDGLAQLKSFEPNDNLFAGAYNLDGEVDLPAMGGIVGGTAPIKGTLIETDPSAYGILEYSGDDKERYVNILLETISGAAVPLRNALSTERDETLIRWLQPIVERDVINATQVIKTNKYLKTCKDYCANTAKSCRAFDSLGLTELHNIPENEKKEKLKEAGLKILSPLDERLANTDISTGMAITTFMGGAGAMLYALKTLPEPVNNYAGFAIIGATIISSMLLIGKGLQNYHIVRNDKTALNDIEGYLSVK